ncbi:MAG: glycoside hydrolase family 88 protein [Rikenellaceae bacterium]
MKKRLFLLCCAIGLALHVSGQFVEQNVIPNSGKDSEQYKSFTFDGAWCWYADPRAVYRDGITYVTWIDRFGSIFISTYNNQTKEQKSVKVVEYFEADDHNVPALLFDKEGYISMFFSEHGDHTGTRVIKSKRPNCIDEWGEIRMLSLNDTSKTKARLNTAYTYAHPIQLEDDSNNIYLYWRGMNYKPTMSVSKDNGESWSTGRIVFAPRGNEKPGRPYTKVFSDGKKKIHFSCTDGHPRDEKHNSIYYFSYTKEGYRNVKGQIIGGLDDILDNTKVDLVYDGSKDGGKAWIWDVAQNKKGNPVIGFVRYPTDQNHVYCRAEWSGKRWIVEDLIDSGKWFPETPIATFESEPNYSGGVMVDKENTDIMYLSVKRNKFFEIEKWTKTKHGWNVEAITKNSTKNNVRPYPIVGAGDDCELQLLWMQNTYYVKFGTPFYYPGYSDDKHYHSSIKSNLTQEPLLDAMDKKQVMAKLKDVADWQLANNHSFKARQDRRDWVWGSFYVGLMELYKMTKDERYLSELKAIGHSNNWTLQPDHFHADRLLTADTWLSLQEMTGDETMSKDLLTRLNAHITRRFNGIVLDRSKQGVWKWWSWCDALYMAPPTFAHAAAVTKQPKYLNYMDTAWKKTAEHLYSKSDSLYYRDDTFIGKTTPNGKKIFWGRGNGWVIGGLVRVLEYMPDNYKERPYYENQFKEMMTKLLTLQREDGLWTASLLDPEEHSMSETSGSALYLYGLMWGINNGLIDAKYKAEAIKGWKTLLSRIDKRGCLGYVQSVSYEPNKFSADQWQLYASGTLFFVAKEFFIMQEGK